MGQHACQAAVVHCIDFRIQKRLHEYLEERFPGSYDLISLAGGAKRLAEGGKEGNTELQELMTSNRLHHPGTVMLIQHEDCGAYGGSGSFRSFEEEAAFHRDELEKAETLLGEQLPGVAVEKFLVRLSGELLPV